ncbi:endocuticle structural glycoprotein SgAbd-2-like [Contarinia nasturtii]|uniref:endocuticle structural glycoprotein SgAbd-2-like n=1 Tax=Contarinia nasturtii TaxID=265458 RepID=UPI0012D43DE2|nr:endocuticle structural glycoprotein SgAbd-2-like [Contarinia nasturtii]
MKFLVVFLVIVSCAFGALLPTISHSHQVHQPVSHHVPVSHSAPKAYAAPAASAYSSSPAYYTPASHHVSGEAAAPILRSSSDIRPDGQYSYEYETGNGISVQEGGHASKAVHGSFSYTSPDGTPIHLTYVADEHGFRPEGAHLPVAPETPPAILRSLEYIAAHPYKEEANYHNTGYYAPAAPQTNYAPVAKSIPVTQKPSYYNFHGQY